MRWVGQRVAAVQRSQERSREGGEPGTSQTWDQSRRKLNPMDAARMNVDEMPLSLRDRICDHSPVGTPRLTDSTILKLTRVDRLVSSRATAMNLQAEGHRVKLHPRGRVNLTSLNPNSGFLNPEPYNFNPLNFNLNPAP